MAQPGTEIKISLKILVDVKSNKVVFAEAGKDFVDFIFHIMSLPLGTVTKLLNEEAGMVGCLGVLYKSIESLDVKYYEPDSNKDSVLKGQTVLLGPFLPFNDARNTIKTYKCGYHNYVSDCRGITCPSCPGRITSEFSLTYVNPTTSVDNTTAGFVKGVMSYMVMDNLEVKPMSLTLIRSVVKDFDYLEEKEVELGLQQGLALLKASLERQAVLTTVFLGNKI